MKLVECVPNFSEGRRLDVVAAIRDAAAGVPGVSVLDLHSDAAHNRSVLTFVGGPAETAEAAFRCVEHAAALIDMRDQRGEHPRIGATDVVPFVPIAGMTMQACVELAEQLGRRIGEDLEIPVYLYARAARRPSRRWLPHVRRGEYEGLAREIGRDPDRAPDFGPARLGPAGATAVGARPFLVAYNVTLATSDLGVARRIAREIRESDGGLPAVQARGMATLDPDVVQVSMNLLDIEQTPLDRAYEAVRVRAAERGVAVIASEVVGLLPLAATTRLARHYVKATAFGADQVLESRLLAALLAERATAPPGTTVTAGR